MNPPHHRRFGRLILIMTVTLIAAAGGACSGGNQPASPQPASRLLGPVAAYITPNDPPTSLPAAVGEISPVWYVPTDTGQLSSTAPAGQGRRLGELARMRNARLQPTVNNYRAEGWDANLITRILTTPTLRTAHQRALVALVEVNHYAGIDLDYEDLPPADRAAYAAFVTEVATALQARGAALSVTVPALTRTPTPANDHGYAYDYAALGAAADQLRIMTYDHAWPTSSPGPVAPSGWVNQVLGYALAQIAPHKIMLGLPGYGYDWVGTRGSDVSATGAVALARTRHATMHRNRDKPWFTYTHAGAKHTVWFEDARSLSPTVALAARRHVGVFLWKLGGEDPALWAVLDHRSGT
jgi:spore germination protein